jgi:hypothetical protein
VPPGDDWRSALRTLTGCVTAQHLVIEPGRRGDRLRVLVFFPAPAPLRVAGALAGSRFGLRMSLDETADSPVVVGYEMVLADRRGVELLTFHRHLPESRGERRQPHAHVSAALRPHQPNGDRGVVPLDKRHLPTGPVTLGGIVTMLIEEFGAVPRAADRRSRLAAAGPPLA